MKKSTRLITTFATYAIDKSIGEGGSGIVYSARGDNGTAFAVNVNTCEITCDPPHDAALCERAAALAGQLHLPLRQSLADIETDIALVVTPWRLELRVLRGEPTLRGGHPVAPDWTGIDVSPGAGGRLSQPIAKAVGRRKGEPPPTVLDATGGFGEDAWLLASLGCRVLCVERNPVMAALLEDALRRADDAMLPAAQRLRILHAYALALLSHPDPVNWPPDLLAFGPPDVVYLDPMFPLGRKTVERKPMRVLRLLAGDDADAAKLLPAALAIARRRVVVKRPRRAMPLGTTPDVSHAGKAARYDVYLPAVDPSAA